MDGEEGRVAADRFSVIFFAEARRLVRLSVLLGAEDPEDVVQEAFCRVFAARRRLRGDHGEVRAYLTRAVVNEVRDRHRRRVVAERRAHLLAAAEVSGEAGSADDREAVMRAVRSLPPRQREAIVLRYWLDLSLDQVAEAMGTRLGTAKAHVSRGVAAVAANLGSLDEHDQDRRRKVL